MIFDKKFLSLLLLTLFLGAALFFHFNVLQKVERKILGVGISTQQTEKPSEIISEGRTKVKYPQDYTIVLLGDSMTEVLGNSDELRAYLKKYYPEQSFEVLNYGFGSTNILSAQERLEYETFYGRTFRPILDIAFDLILIESFGHNPLSQFPLEEGLKKQTSALDKMVETITRVNPSAKIIFVATIAPHKSQYGQGKVDLSQEQRTRWVEERIAYIQNHISYANSHHIPLINIYQKSLNNDQDGKLDYISSIDFIHPSPNGVYFISEEIAKFIFKNQILTP